MAEFCAKMTLFLRGSERFDFGDAGMPTLNTAGSYRAGRFSWIGCPMGVLASPGLSNLYMGPDVPNRIQKSTEYL